ncbi:MAG: transporter [Phenylobacterium sp.]|nr:transporter [Phenylobacterium sp.]
MLAVLTVINVCNQLDRTLISILLPGIKRDLALSDSQIGLATGPAFAFCFALTSLPLAWLSERVNRTRLIGAALFFWSVATGLCGAVTSFWQLMFVRIAVASGEAGGSPPSYAMVADAFPLSRRPTVMAVFAAAGALGAFISLLLGGWINQFWGWRVTFIAAAALGAVLLPLILFTVRDPERGGSDPGASTAAVSAGEALRRLRRSPTFFFLAIAATLTTFGGYAMNIWMPSFISRSYGLTSGQIGSLLSLSALVGGVGGGIAWAELARRMGRRDLRWWMWIPAIASALAAPCLITAITVHNLTLTIGFQMLASLGLTAYAGSLYATVSAVVSPRMRGVASSSILFFQIAVGLGLGPLITGAASDLLTHKFAREGLRYAMLIPATSVALSAPFYWLAGRHIRQDAQVGPQ